MAGEQFAQSVPLVHQLHGGLLPYTYLYYSHDRFLDGADDDCQQYARRADDRLGGTLVAGLGALRADVGSFYWVICVHAQHLRQLALCHRTRHYSWCGHPVAAVVLRA